MWGCIQSHRGLHVAHGLWVRQVWYMMSSIHKLKSDEIPPLAWALMEKPEPRPLNLEVRVGGFHRETSHLYRIPAAPI